MAAFRDPDDEDECEDDERDASQQDQLPPWKPHSRSWFGHFLGSWNLNSRNSQAFRHCPLRGQVGAIFLPGTPWPWVSTLHHPKGGLGPPELRTSTWPTIPTEVHPSRAGASKVWPVGLGRWLPLLGATCICFFSFVCVCVCVFLRNFGVSF